MIGEVKMVANEEVPDGHLECNGQAVSKSTYADLFDSIGYRYGHVNNDDFKVPDIRGIIVRGWDHGAGNDPDVNGREPAGEIVAIQGTARDQDDVLRSIGGDQIDRVKVGMKVTDATANAFVGTVVTSIDKTLNIINFSQESGLSEEAVVFLQLQFVGNHVGTKQDDAVQDHR